MRAMEAKMAEQEAREVNPGNDTTWREELATLRESLLDRLEEVKDDLALVKRASREGGTRKLKVPEPQVFVGARDAKALDNFLWDMEEYFKALSFVLEQSEIPHWIAIA